MPRRFFALRRTLKPGSRPALEAWIDEINANTAEVDASLQDEGIRLELVFLDRVGDEDNLVWVFETDDYERAREIFLRSTRPIDLYHRAFLEQHVASARPLELLSVNEAP
ncbi:MAG TPA: DUF6176 family protein [Azospirillaceae bacterium]|nr:DUF6176 family protein [Azospirillaceae bacterium]